VKFTAVAFVALTLLLGAGVAHADSQDSQYLSAVSALGITAPADQLIAGGHAVCDGVGNSGAELAAQGQLLAAGVPYGQVGQVFIAAGRAYCPDKLHSLGLS
jgi:hypothetical protein